MNRLFTGFSIILCAGFAFFSSHIVQAQTSRMFVQDETSLDHRFYHANFIGGGAAFVDIDNDDDDDIYLTGGEKRDRIFINDGTGVFTEIFPDVLVMTDSIYTTGVNYGDIDGDGDNDLYINVYFEKGEDFAQNLLFINNGDYTFDEVWRDTPKDSSMTMGTTLIDYDMDGDLDIYNVNYVEVIRFTYDEEGAVNGFDHDCFRNYMYRNNGDNTFTDVTDQLSINDNGCAFVVVATDFDSDGDPDILIGNDFGPFIIPNKLYRNDYNISGRFTDISTQSDANFKMFSMGIGIGDIDGDLDLDYYVSNLGKNVLMVQDQDGHFENMSGIAGVENEFSAGGPSLSVSWGNLMTDIDNDMDLDIYVANGYVPAPAFVDNSNLDPDRLFLNNGDGTFTEVDSTKSGINNPLSARGCIYGDVDMDGKMDIFTVVYNKPLFGLTGQSCLFRNQINNDNNWVKIKLTGVKANTNAFGSRVYVYSGDDVQMAELTGGGSFCSQHSSILHFGIGAHESIDSVRVVWPGGQSQLETDLSINTLNKITQEIGSTVSDLEPNSVKLWPNPASKNLHVFIQSTNGIKSIEMLSMDGRPILKTSSMIIDLQNIHCGVYYVKITSTSGYSVIKKLIIQQ